MAEAEKDVQSPQFDGAAGGTLAQLDATQDYPESAAGASPLVQLLDRYLAQLKAGQAPDRDRLLADHPELAEQLAACLAGIDFIHGGGIESAASPRQLGDFRILREIGRGGMGAVYEAEQLSLRRRVAVKVLRLAGVSDPESVQRFQREAETVARLHHTNIVPIFAVGCEQGVNYYAMQFIEGRSLDQVLRDQGGPADPRTVAQWGLEAAEALAYAHGRGVIHRDVKPSNLILDHEEGRIWLTDFGLAKRLDDVTLSLSGALLGTPRYMSPEQAGAAHHRLDHRTDIYSLGASLYELVTGKPVFSGDSPHHVISQILTVEPDPPRKHRPSLPRDLDTILLKCLSKEPGQRYESARQLAEDLRAFRDGRPIAARRIGLVERTARWVRRQRRSVALTAAAVAATLFLVAAGLVAGYAWHRAQLAFVMLKTEHPPLVAEFTRDGAPAVPPVTVPTQRRLEVPAGEYQMRLAGDGRLSQTVGVTLSAGEFFDRELDLEDQTLWSGTKLERTYHLVHFRHEAAASSPLVRSAEGDAASPADGCADLVLVDEDGVRCVSGRTGAGRWQLQLREPVEPRLKDELQLVWPWHRGMADDFGVGRFDRRPWIVGAAGGAGSPPFDLNRDGTSDLLVAARHQAWIIAVSGSDGVPLWTVADADAASTFDRRQWRPDSGAAVVYPPTVVADQDGDGISDLMAAVVVKLAGQPAERRVELRSGATGASIWRHDLRAELFALPATESVPYDLSWFYGTSGGYSRGGSIRSQGHHYRTRESGRLTRSGPHEYLPTAPHLLGPAAHRVCFLAGKHLVQLDLSTGQALAAPADLGMRTGAEPRYGDFDGDGNEDVLLIEPRPERTVPQANRPAGAVPQTRLAAWSLAKQTWLWQRDLQAAWPRQEEMSLLPPDWPQVADVDGDGADDVLVPDGSTEGLNSWYAPPWGQLALLDGSTGQARWHRQLFNLDEQLDCFLAGPDINGDGCREVYVAAVWSDSAPLFVDCLSGADGSSLWRAEHSLASPDHVQPDFWLGNLAWYDAGGDGWPQLVVSARDDRHTGDAMACFFSAGTGRMTHRAGQVTDVQAGDLDADGVDDLVLLRQVPSAGGDRGGRLQAIRGVGREPWRKILPPQRAVGDLDSDGVADLVEAQTSGPLAAISAATGRRLWATRIAKEPGELHVHPAATREPRHDLLETPHDLDGDGTPDLLLTAGEERILDKRPIVVAVSGRTGQRLWQAEIAVQRTDGTLLLDCRDLDGDGQAEILFAAATDYGLPLTDYRNGMNEARLWLAVLSGRDGRTRWVQPLTDTLDKGHTQPRYDLQGVSLEAVYADLDGDRIEDVLLPAQPTAGSAALELRAWSGADGRVLWVHELPEPRNVSDAVRNAPPPAVGDLDGDGRLEVITLALTEGKDAQGYACLVLRVLALDGPTGQPRWQWEAPADSSSSDVGRQGERLQDRLRPLLVRRPDGRQWIALASWRSGREIHVLDESGKLVSKATQTLEFLDHGLRIWTVDADGDGGDELAVLTETGLALLPPDQLERPRWRLPQVRADSHRILGILPAAAARGRIVVRGVVPEGSLRGIEPASGELAWTCVGPSSPGLRIAAESVALLNAPQAQVPPHALYQYRGQTYVRRGVDRSGAAAAWQAFARPPAILAPAGLDPRLSRPLPWKPEDYQLRQWPPFVAWAAFYGITLAALPVLLLGWMIRRRRWGLKTVLMLPLVAGLVLLAVRVHPADREFQSLASKLGLAYFGAGPVIGAAAACGVWLRQGRWRRVLLCLSLALLAGLALMAVRLLAIAPAEGAALQPGERYSWAGWYFVFLPMFYLLAWVLTVVAGISSLRAMRR